MDFSANINEDNIIELKSKDFLPPKNDEMVKKLGNDIKTKLKDNSFKFYIIGYDESTKKYDYFLDNTDIW